MSKSRADAKIEYDTDKVDAAVLALLHLNSWLEPYGLPDGPEHVSCAWKSLNWSALARLHDADLISDPQKKSKSVVLTEAGAARAAEECRRLFGKDTGR